MEAAPAMTPLGRHSGTSPANAGLQDFFTGDVDTKQ